MHLMESASSLAVIPCLSIRQNAPAAKERMRVDLPVPVAPMMYVFPSSVIVFMRGTQAMLLRALGTRCCWCGVPQLNAVSVQRAAFRNYDIERREDYWTLAFNSPQCRSICAARTERRDPPIGGECLS